MQDEIALSRGIVAQLDSKTKAKEFYVRSATTLHMNSSWDGGGSRDTFYAFDTDGLPIALPAHTGCTSFGGSEADVQLDGKPYATIVRESIFRGKHLKPVIYVQPLYFDIVCAKVAHEQGTGNLTDAQLYALAVTAQLKSAGRLDAFTRKYDASLWDATREQLRDMQLLRKNNAITPAGRNAASDVRLR